MTTREKKLLFFVGIPTAVVSACLGLETQRSNHLGWALLIAGIAFIAFGSITLAIMFVNEAREKPAPGRSLWLPVLGVLLISLVAPLEYLYVPPILERSHLVQDFGLILFVCGFCFILLMIHSGRAAYTTDRLSTGIIQWVWRPAFASLMLFALGLSIGYSSLVGLLVAFLLVLPGLIYSMAMEDRNLRMI
jgi:integral membrane sensor domain MASE1